MKFVFFFSAILLTFIGCKSSQTFDQSELVSEKLNEQYSISLPKNYKGQGYWVGEDSKGFKKEREDGKVSFRCEFGKRGVIETIQSPSIKETPEVLKNYKKEGVIKLSNKSKAVFYTLSTTAKVRDTEGILLIEQPSGATIEILRVSYMKDLLNEVKAIIKTIK